MIYKNNNTTIELTSAISLIKADFDAPETLDFLRSVYKSTRYEEMAMSGWPQAEIETFLNQQFQFQHQGYTTTYTEAQFYIILIDNQKAGRLYIEYWPKEIRLIDLALLPEFRGTGSGSAIINILKAEAIKLERPLSLNVETVNRAQSLYKRMGFKEKTNDDVYMLMEYDAKNSIPTQSVGTI